MASLRSDGLPWQCCLYVCTTLITSVMFVCFPRCVRFWQRRSIIAFYFMRGSWFNKARKKKKKRKQALFPHRLLVRLRDLEQQGADPRFHPHPVVRALPLPVHADGTALPDFIWGNLIPPLLPLERRSISGHMSTRFVRLFITINCCST